MEEIDEMNEPSCGEETEMKPLKMDEEQTQGGKSRRKLWIVVICVAVVLCIAAVVALFLTRGFGKYKGYKKDRATGIYYQFYGDVNDTAVMPKTGDLVGILFSLSAGDSLLIPMTPNELLMDSLYEGDLYAAIRMMHVGDSASFVLDGPEFFRHFMQDTVYPFGKDPLYLNVKLYAQMPAAQFQQMRAEYEKMLRDKKNEEQQNIQAYVAEHFKGVTPTAQGLYIKTLKKGTGAQPKQGQTVTVHYTGKFLDGKSFDSSVDRNEPFKFMLGIGQVIPGWDITVAGMRVGEKLTVLIPSDYAYGERGNYAIPPYSPLVFDIELLGIDDGTETAVAEY